MVWFNLAQSDFKELADTAHLLHAALLHASAANDITVRKGLNGPRTNGHMRPREVHRGLSHSSTRVCESVIWIAFERISSAQADTNASLIKKDIWLEDSCRPSMMD